MRPVLLLAALPLAACRSLAVPGPATPYSDEQVRLAREWPAAPPSAEATALREAVAALGASARPEADLLAASAEAEGLLDLDAPGVRAAVDGMRDPAVAEASVAAGPVDLERVLLLAYARNPAVAAARAAWRAALRMYDQAAYLEDVLLRTRAFAFRGPGAMPTGSMAEPAFPYPGGLALRGLMISSEVAMAREGARMRLRDVLSGAAMAYLEAARSAEEVALRDAEIAFVERMVVAARAGVASGRSPQAELLETEAELAMVRNDRAQAVATSEKARATLNTWLARDPVAPIAPARVGDPPSETPALAELLALAAKYAPEPRMKRAEAERTAAAIRMAEAMAFAAPPPAPAGPAETGGGIPGPRGRAPSGGGGDGMSGSMGAATSSPPEPASPSGAWPPLPGAPPTPPLRRALDLAWVAELRERHAGLEREAEEARRAVERAVAAAHLEMDAARRAFAVARGSAVPLAQQAADERVRSYEAGRGEFAEVYQAYRRFLAARRAELDARYEHAEARAKAWEAAGARPEALPARGG